jgi:hypothetical protein
VLRRNPCDSVHPTELGPSTQTTPTEAEALSLFRIATTRDNAARWSVGRACGLRQGEALGLRWSYVDIDVLAGEVGAMRVWWQLQRLPWEHGCTDADPAVTAERDPNERRKRATAVVAACEQWHKRPCPKRCPKEAGVRPAARLHPRRREGAVREDT